MKYERYKTLTTEQKEEHNFHATQANVSLMCQLFLGTIAILSDYIELTVMCGIASIFCYVYLIIYTKKAEKVGK